MWTINCTPVVLHLVFEKETWLYCEQYTPWSDFFLRVLSEYALLDQVYLSTQQAHNVETTSIQRSITKTRLFKYTKNFTTKNWKFSDKNSDIFSYFCSKLRLWYSLEPPRWGGSNEYQQSMFLSRNKKINIYPWKLQFYYIKVGLKGVKII